VESLRKKTEKRGTGQGNTLFISIKFTHWMLSWVKKMTRMKKRRIMGGGGGGNIQLGHEGHLQQAAKIRVTEEGY